MICSVKQSPTITNGCDIFLRSKTRPSVQGSLHLPSLPLKKFQRSVLSVQKPLHVSSIGSFGSLARKSLIRCQAYEADRSEPVESNIELPKVETRSEAAKKLKIGVYFAMWWALNVVFNIYNKKVLNAYPFPWLTSTLSLACGSLIMLVSWATRIAEAPKTDMEFWKALFPVSWIGFYFVGSFYFFLVLCEWWMEFTEKVRVLTCYVLWSLDFVFFLKVN